MKGLGKDLALVAFGLLLGVGYTALAQTLRLEATVGVSQHALAPEGSWHYSGFPTNNKLLAGSYTVGLQWMPIKRDVWSFGLRGGYADLGKVKANNEFPIHEDWTNKDARVNPSCNKTTLDGCTGRFEGQGTTRGIYLGIVAERDFGGGVALGGELGAYHYKASWKARNVMVLDDYRDEFKPLVWDGFVWNEADSKHTTPYIGAHARWHYLLIAGRIYGNVHASRSEVNPGFIGMTDGIVWSFLVGLSLPL